MSPPRSGPQPPFRLQSGGHYQPAPKRVLVASDVDDLRRELALALQKDGHYVVELADGLELLDYLDGSLANGLETLPRPDAIVASLTMTGMGGLDLLEALRRLDDRTPFIGLAGPSDTVDFDRMRELGAAYIFEAPLRLDDIREALHSLPGGVFREGKLERDERLEACRRGMQFMDPDAER